MHHTLAIAVLIGFIAFAFGERTARLCVQAGILACLLFVAYFMFRVLTDGPNVEFF